MSAHTRRHMPAHSSTQLLQQHKFSSTRQELAARAALSGQPAGVPVPPPSSRRRLLATRPCHLPGSPAYPQTAEGWEGGSFISGRGPQTAAARMNFHLYLCALCACALLALRARADCGGAHQAHAVLQPGSTTPYPPAHQAGASWQNTSWQNTTHLQVVPAQQPLLHKRPQPAEPLQDAACACGAGQCVCGGVAAGAPREAGTRGAAPAPLCVPPHAGRLQHGMPAPPRAVTWPVLLIIVGQVVVLPAG